jgi:hypothetical protein
MGCKHNSLRFGSPLRQESGVDSVGKSGVIMVCDFARLCMKASDKYCEECKKRGYPEWVERVHEPRRSELIKQFKILLEKPS